MASPRSGAGPSPSGLRSLPSVRLLLEQAPHLRQAHGHAAVAGALRGALQAARAAIRAGAPPSGPEALIQRAAAALDQAARPVLRRAINATGIVLHTNLGRAPLGPAARAAVTEAMEGYCTLEFDVASGRRGERTQGVEPLLRRLTGAEAAVCVNNNAAAMLLALTALAAGGEVVVSRGELVEIGGGFRIPDIIGQGGARLVEVGTTNRTRLADYRAAIGPATRVLLKVHQSNFRIIGFTEAPDTAALAGLAHEHGLPLLVDLGSGVLHGLPLAAGAGEPTVGQCLAAGADLVAFSGDKLLGGPQAGIVAGDAALLAPLRRHPLMRALRLDKLSLAALEGTLRASLAPAPDLPVLRMLGEDAASVQARAARLAALLPGAELVASEAQAGGGALPALPLPSSAVALPGGEALAARLRQGTPAVVGRVQGGRLLLDLRTVDEAEVPLLAERVRAAMAP